MAISMPNGALVALASGYGSALTVTILTNANPAVATSTAHGLANGDYVEVTSGWSRLTDKILRVANVTTNTFELEGYDTTSTTIYPAGTGTGSVRKITGWTQLSQVLNSSSSGGEQQFLDYQLLEGDSQKRIPTFKNSAGLTFEIADDATLAGYILASAANDDRLPRAIRITLPSASKLLYNAYVSLNKTPSLNVNQIMSCQVTMSLKAEVVRYAT
jgi:hypothetical protein